MNSNTIAHHIPVLLERCAQLLEPAIARKTAPLIVDATCGLGGHSEYLLQNYPNLRIIGLDRDRQACEFARERLRPYEDRCEIVQTVFSAIASTVQKVCDSRGWKVEHTPYTEAPIDGALFDLGVSSMQLDSADRGFSYSKDVSLDMRMDQDETAQSESVPASIGTAADLLEGGSAHELARIFTVYGDEPLARRYAEAIVQARKNGAITSSAHLVEILQDATPAGLRNKRHPAKRVFQALRVVVNNELAHIDHAIPAAMRMLTLGGRLVVMSYQSHEDRAIKGFFKEGSVSTAPKHLPFELEEHKPEFRLLTRGAETASSQEQLENSRSKPVRLRAIERVRYAPVAQLRSVR